jgi:hypothetical protein
VNAAEAAPGDRALGLGDAAGGGPAIRAEGMNRLAPDGMAGAGHVAAQPAAVGSDRGEPATLASVGRTSASGSPHRT